MPKGKPVRRQDHSGGGGGGPEKRFLAQFPHIDRPTAAAIYAQHAGRLEEATQTIIAEDERRFLAAHPDWESGPPVEDVLIEIKGKSREDSVGVVPYI